MNRSHPAFRPCRAFTLIELLIVVTMIPITSIAVYGLAISLADAREYTHARITAQESAARAAAAWRADVSLASRAERAPDGRSMTVWRSNSPEAGVRYEALPNGNLTRLLLPAPGAPPALPEVLDRQSTALHFSRVGRGYRMEWTHEYSDGLKTLRWPRAAFATPLTAGEAK